MRGYGYWNRDTGIKKKDTTIIKGSIHNSSLNINIILVY